MLQTKYQDFNFTVTDSTVLVNPGVARTGDSIVFFRGDSITFNQMTSFAGAADKYQYSALYVHDLRDTTNAFTSPQADLTSTRSALGDSINELSFPVLSGDSSAYAVGLFLFGTPDGTMSLYSSQRIMN